MSLRPVVLTAFLAVCCNLAFAQFAGQNINMVSGTTWPSGDPFLQRQNEPSMAVSSRNPEHILGGANDYRTVDIPNPMAANILGDAWLGVFTSLDGGETFRSTLLPGYPQDTSSVGTSSPLHAFTVATDPTVRAGTNGIFYYSGLVFNRGAGAPSGVFVATFQDQNNKGNGDAAILMKNANGTTHGNPFLYIGATIVDSFSGGQFLDKPWIAVDIPRTGRTATCKVNGQTFSSGYVYVVYTQFNGSQNNPASKIKVVTSANCGATWSMPETLSQSEKLAQGTVAAIDPTTGNVIVAWRQIATSNLNQPDSIQYAISTNGGNSFSSPPPAFTFPQHTTSNPYPVGGAFDQPSASTTAFRTLDVPSLAVDGTGQAWLAFSERVNGPTAGTYGSRIMVTTLPEGGSKWATPWVADSSLTASTYAFQFMPSLNFAYGKMALAWFDNRRDNLENTLQCLPAGKNCAGLSDLTPVDVPIPHSSATATVFNSPSITDPNSGIRHTIDVFGAVIDPTKQKMFPGFQVSQYGYWVNPSDNNQIEQAFFNPPNLPMFVQGTTPFIGDYLDIAAQTILPSGNSWAFNTQATDATGATNAPDFHFTWTDNRDVVPPPVVGGKQDWTQYVPPNSGASPNSSYLQGGTACPTCPPQTQPACSTVSDDNGAPSAYSGDRNQNVYTSRVTNGLVVRFRENAKVQPAGAKAPAQGRSYSLLIKNTVPPLQAKPLGSPSFYRILLGVTSTSQSCTLTVTGGTSSLAPTTPNCYLDVAINPGTTSTQAVTINSTSAAASLNVLVAQEQAIPAVGSNPVYSGLQALAVINADPTNPSVADPDFVTPDDSDPDLSTPYGNLPIANDEEYNPTVDGPIAPNANNTGVVVDVSSALVTQPAIGGNTGNNAPAVTVTTPRITTPRITSVQVVNPQIVNAITTPRITTPRITTPRIVSPDITTPRITDLADGTNPVTDYTWTVNNEGNTTASYDTQELLKASGVNCCPAGVTNSSCSVCQLIQQNVYESPTPNRESTNANPTCDLNIQQSYTTVANISDPSFTTGSATGNPSNPMSSTLALCPGCGNRVTLRVVAQPVTQETISSFKTQATSFTPNTGQNTPAGSLTITTGALPVAVVGQKYTNTTLTSVGGFGTTYWSVPATITSPVAVEPPPSSPEALPVSPLTLSPNGQISTSVVTQPPGTYTVNMQVQDSAVTGTGGTPNPALDVQQVLLEVNQFTIQSLNVAIPNEVGSTSYMRVGDMATITVTIDNQGPATATSVVPTITVNAVASGTPSGPIPVVTCGAPTPTSATIIGSNTQGFSFTCKAVSGNGYITFTANATGQYVNAAAAVVATAVPMSQPSVTPSMTPPNIVVDTTQPFLTFGNTTSTPSAPGWYNAPVVVPYTTSDNLSGQYTIAATSPATSTGLNGQGAGAMTLTSEGKPVTGTLTLSDYANNSQMFTSQGYNIDETKPMISGAVPPADAFGWYNAPVTVTFTCVDPPPANGPAGQQSGIATCTPPVVVPGEGTNLGASGTAVDNAANSASTTVSGINIDTTAPSITGGALPVANTYGWNNTPVTVSFVCSDPNPLHGPAGQQSTIATCTAPVTLTGEGANQTVPGAAVDKAGNSTPVTVSGINIDKTPPVVTASSTYAPNVWTNQSVMVVFTCTDNLSGPVLSPTVNPIIAGIPAVGSTLTYSQPNSVTSIATVTLTANTPLAGTTLTASCQDQAGNNATPASFGPILIDTTPPTITATANLGSSSGPAYAANNWTNQSVVVTFACSDALSGVKQGSISASPTYAVQGTYTANGSCMDIAGNTATTSFGPVEIDTTTPAVMITGPMAQTYILNSTITPAFTCGDNSGGDTTTCTETPSGSPYTASPVGPSIFSIQGMDQAGNTSNASVNYLVIYNFTGFQAPLQAAVMMNPPNPPVPPQPSDSGGSTIGSVIPVAWQLQDANSNLISDLTTLTSIVAIQNPACAGAATGSATTLYSAAGNIGQAAFSYDSTNSRFVFNWDTTAMSIGCYNLVVTTNDTAQWSTIVHLGQSFAVGNTPYAIAFDGTNMWVPDSGDNNVTELAASTGAPVGTYSVGAGPDGVFFDGTNIWVANTTDATVTKLSTSGSTIGVYPVGIQPWGIASDGSNIWVTNRSSRSVTELSATGVTIGTYAVGNGPYGIAFDGTNMWVANDYDSTVTKLSPGGAVLGTYAVGNSPVGVAFDGANIWVADQTGGVGTVTKLALSGAVLGTFPAGPAPNDILFDGKNIWVANNSSNTMTELATSTGAILGTYTVGPGPYKLAFDGTNIWATIPGSNSVTKMPVY